MRVKDEIKQVALFMATVEPDNEAGFATASVSKVAEAANVSPVSIYLYCGNKEELLDAVDFQIKTGEHRDRFCAGLTCLTR